MKKFSILYLVLISLSFLFFACEYDYLDKTEKADLSSEDVFTDFNKFNGYVEILYGAINISHVTGGELSYMFNYGDDNIYARHNYLQNGDYLRAISHIGMFTTSSGRTDGVGYAYNTGDVRDIGVWSGWQAIRIANNALDNLDKLVNATQEEKDIIAGQCYFFRGHFHWEIMRAWGAVPYVDVFFNPESNMEIPVLSFHETAEKVIKDLEKAAELLPEDWDDTDVGQRTIGNNYGRVRSSTATGLKSEVLIYCGSPLMNGVSTGNYSYNEDYLKRAAETAWEMIEYHRQGLYELEPWESYSNIFYAAHGENSVPGGPEIVLNPPIKFTDNKYTVKQYILKHLGNASFYESPTASYVEKFEMENGYPIKDPESGYDPNNPWKNRDPRFYYNILLDGEQIVFSEPDFAQFYVGGRDRGQPNSLTGYGVKKYTDLKSTNNKDGLKNTDYVMNAPRLRLAEIYLFYAEAVNEVYGPSGKVPGTDLTAVDAVNIIRNRSNMPDVHAKFTGNKEDFRKRIWNERAIELAYEGKRWFDLRRWYVAHKPEYRVLDALDFDKDHTYYKKRVVTEVVFDMKYYWLPFPIEQVSIYEGWKQNLGW